MSYTRLQLSLYKHPCVVLHPSLWLSFSTLLYVVSITIMNFWNCKGSIKESNVEVILAHVFGQCRTLLIFNFRDHQHLSHKSSSFRQQICQTVNFLTWSVRTAACLGSLRSMKGRNQLQLVQQKGCRNFLEIKWSKTRASVAASSFQGNQRDHQSLRGPFLWQSSKQRTVSRNITYGGGLKMHQWATLISEISWIGNTTLKDWTVASRRLLPFQQHCKGYEKFLW